MSPRLFCAALIGVVVNAVGFAARAPSGAAIPPRAAPRPPGRARRQPPAAPAARAPTRRSSGAQLSRLDAPPTPVARPQERPAERLGHHAKPDPITDLLRNGRRRGQRQGTVLAAQRALIKLGYDIKADGVLGEDTQRALRDFEKSHGLPVEPPKSRRACSPNSTRRRAEPMDLRADIWVAAYLQTGQREGAFAALRERGSPEAGAIYVLVDRLDGRVALYAPRPPWRASGAGCGPTKPNG